MVQTYNEFKVFYDKDKIIDKKPTARKTVRIDKRTAEINNMYSKSTNLLYELAEDQPVNEVKKPGRKPKEEK